MQMLGMSEKLASETPLGQALNEIFSDMASDAEAGISADEPQGPMPRMRLIRLPALGSLFSGMGAMPQPTVRMHVMPLQQMASELPPIFSGPSMPGMMSSSVRIEHRDGHTIRTETTTDTHGKVHASRTVTEDAASKAQEGQDELRRLMDEVMQPMGLPSVTADAIAEDIAGVSRAVGLTADEPAEEPKEQDDEEEEPRRTGPISDSEAEAAVKSALKPEEVSSAAGRATMARAVAQSLGLHAEDVQVSSDNADADADADESAAPEEADADPTYVPATPTTVMTDDDDDDDKAAEVVRVIEGAEAEKVDAQARFADAANRALAAKAEEADGEQREQAARTALDSAIADADKEVAAAEEEVQEAFTHQQLKQNSLARLQQLKTKIDSTVN
jgi:hypothetical protein